MNTIIIKENNKILGHISSYDNNFYKVFDLIQESYSQYKKYENSNGFILEDYVDFHNILYDTKIYSLESDIRCYESDIQFIDLYNKGNFIGTVFQVEFELHENSFDNFRDSIIKSFNQFSNYEFDDEILGITVEDFVDFYNKNNNNKIDFYLVDFVENTKPIINNISKFNSILNINNPSNWLSTFI